MKEYVVSNINKAIIKQTWINNKSIIKQQLVSKSKPSLIHQ